MRFGYVLEQYTAPEWRAYSVRYDEIKNVIKKSLESSISPDTERAVYALIQEQFERVNIFVRSKTGELERRIRNCAKAVDIITKEDSLRTYPIPSSQRQKPIIKVEIEIESIYIEFRALARFVSAHRIAFLKFVKTYNKYSHTSSMSTMFSVLVESPKSFTKKNFTNMIVEFSFLYDSVRRFSQQSLRFFSKSNRDSFSSGDLDFESASTMASSSFIFWIHPDNLVELKVLLLKYLSILPSESMYRQSLQLNDEYAIESNTRIVYVNGITAFAAICDKNLNRNDVARAVADLDVDNPDAILCIPNGATLSGRRKYIESIVNGSTNPNDLQQLDSIGKSVLSWLDKQSARPSVGVSVKRIRYEQLASSGSTVWATLDSSISFNRVETHSGWLDSCDSRDQTKLPYSVLEIRWQGTEPKWLSELKNSHTVYHVDSFNYFAHASFITGMSAVRPSWVDSLDGDIHRIPDIALSLSGSSSSSSSIRSKLKKRASSSRVPASVNSVPSTSSESSGDIPTSIDTSNELVTPATTISAIPSDRIKPASNRSDSIMAGSIKPNLIKERMRRHRDQTTLINPSEQYWNEFDNPEESDEVFYIDPTSESTEMLPKLPFEKFTNWSSQLWSRMSKKANNVEYISHDSDDEERQLLLVDSDNSEPDPSGTDLSRIRTGSRDADPETYYYALLGVNMGDVQSVDRALTIFYSISLTISLVVSSLLGAIIFGGSLDGTIVPVYISGLASVGLLFSSVIALAGFIAFYYRSRTASLLHAAVVYVVFAFVTVIGLGGVSYFLMQ
ncbi:hypothetical protein V1511DRAFT_489013 [Dipodascopsis uninucleata]